MAYFVCLDNVRWLIQAPLLFDIYRINHCVENFQVQCTLYTVHCTLYTVHRTLYTVQCTPGQTAALFAANEAASFGVADFSHRPPYLQDPLRRCAL